MNLLEELGKAAARGVQVTIVTNHYEPAPITLKWEFKQFNWGQPAAFVRRDWTFMWSTRTEIDPTGNSSAART